MRSMRRIGTAVVVAALTLVVSTVVKGTTASAAIVPSGCKILTKPAPNVVPVKCAGVAYHGSEFRILATSCSSNGLCKNEFSPAVNYGGTASVSGPYPISTSSVIVQWHDTSSGGTGWCEFTKPGGTVTWCDMQASIEYWAKSRQPYYDESGATHPYNWYHDEEYRPDCSGMVSMAWHVVTSASNNWGYWTGNIESVASAVTWSYSTSLSHIQPGDLLNDKSDGHAVLFAGWDSDHVHFKVWSFGAGQMTTGNLFDHQPDSRGDVAGWPKGHYHAFRYDNATGTKF